jgi:hypothetical protein
MSRSWRRECGQRSSAGGEWRVEADGKGSFCSSPCKRFGASARPTDMKRITAFVLVVMTAACSRSSARADHDFDTTVANPTYSSAAPTVLFDEAHHNIHKAGGTYAPFAKLVANDGYTVRRNRKRFTATALRSADVVVIANALGRNDRNDDPAFTDVECDVLTDWIRRGGSLLLITDHYPTGSAVANLARRLGVDMSGGVTEDSTSFDARFDPSHIVHGDLPQHQITTNVRRILTFTGQSLSVPHGAIALLPLGSGAIDRAATPRVERAGGDVRVHVEYGAGTPARGRAQAIAFAFGQGRVVVLAEAAMASAQLSAYDGSPFGMNVSGYDNRQFILNVTHWLSGKVP